MTNNPIQFRSKSSPQLHEEIKFPFVRGNGALRRIVVSHGCNGVAGHQG